MGADERFVLKYLLGQAARGAARGGVEAGVPYAGLRLATGYARTKPTRIGKVVGGALRGIGVKTDIGRRTLGKSWRHGVSDPLGIVPRWIIARGSGRVQEAARGISRGDPEFYRKFEQHRRAQGRAGGSNRRSGPAGPTHRTSSEIRKEFFGDAKPRTPDELKKQFRAHAVKHHPDRGGNPDTFMKMKSLYDDMLADPGHLKAASVLFVLAREAARRATA